MKKLINKVRVDNIIKSAKIERALEFNKKPFASEKLTI